MSNDRCKLGLCPWGNRILTRIPFWKRSSMNTFELTCLSKSEIRACIRFICYYVNETHVNEHVKKHFLKVIRKCVKALSLSLSVIICIIFLNKIHTTGFINTIIRIKNFHKYNRNNNSFHDLYFLYSIYEQSEL